LEQICFANVEKLACESGYASPLSLGIDILYCIRHHNKERRLDIWSIFAAYILPFKNAEALNEDQIYKLVESLPDLNSIRASNVSIMDRKASSKPNSRQRERLEVVKKIDEFLADLLTSFLAVIRVDQNSRSEMMKLNQIHSNVSSGL